jgi:glutaredoxin-related protein
MPRLILDASRIHSAVGDQIGGGFEATVREVEQAVASHAVVVVGMRQNPFPRKARKALSDAGIAHHYLEYGSYFAEWRRRLALKMWTGWPTLPMIFVRGRLIGGHDDLVKLMASGEFKRMLA